MVLEKKQSIYLYHHKKPPCPFIHTQSTPSIHMLTLAIYIYI